MYYTSFQTDIPLMTNIFNYTVYLDLTTIGSPLGMFLSLVRNDLTEAIFGFDNGLRLKDYFILTAADSYTVTGNIATFRESIFVRNSVPDSVFQLSSTVVLDFDINTVVLGSATTNSIQTDSTVFATINQPPGKYDIQEIQCMRDIIPQWVWLTTSYIADSLPSSSGFFRLHKVTAISRMNVANYH